MLKMRTFVTVNGELHGSIWMPAAHCFKYVRERVEITHESIYSHGTAPDIRTALLNILNDGDFRNAEFTPDTEIAIERECWLAPGRVTLSGARSGNSITADKPMLYRRRRVIDLSENADFVEACDEPHMTAEDEDFGEEELA